MPTVNYLWNPINDNIIAEYDDDGNTIAEYTTEPGYHGAVISEQRDGVTYQHHYDAQGNTRALTDDQGNVTDTFAYTANGEVTERTGTTPTPYQYGGEHGYYTDQTSGEIMVRRRDFDPAQGRWLSVDPSGFGDGINLYRYVYTNPVNLIDPSGLECAAKNCCCCADKVSVSPQKDLVPKDDITKCHRGRPSRVGDNSYGNEFLLSGNLSKKVSDEDKPCILNYSEAASQDFIARDGTVVLKACDKPVDQYARFPKVFAQWDMDAAGIKCPSALGFAFFTDCPITPLIKDGDSRLLCIKATVKSTCTDCEKDEVVVYIKQICERIAGKNICKVTHGDKEQCTDADWKKYCPKK